MKRSATEKKIIASIRWQQKRYNRNPTIAEIAESAHVTVCSVLAIVVKSKKLDYTVGTVDGERDDGAGWTVEII